MLESDRTAIVARLRQTLLDTANHGGGWGYYAGNRSRIEPTSWALVALTTAEPDTATPQPAPDHLAFLASCQRADGLLADDPRMPPNLTANGIAGCALAEIQASAQPRLLPRLADGIASLKGVGYDVPDPRQNNKLQGWPWIPDTFSWVEPTSWCLLALKKTRGLLGEVAAPRVKEAEQLLENRMCVAGGWNYGNASALGQDLRPYVPTTAAALIALQDRRSDAFVGRGLAYLGGARLTESSAMALALTAICLRLYGVDSGDVDARLIADAPRAEKRANLQSLAMMVCALSARPGGAKALRV